MLAQTARSLQAETLLLALDGTICIIRTIQTDSLSAETVSSLIACTLKLWQTYPQDSYINSYVVDILQAIVAHPTEEILGLACRDGVPLIQQVLAAPDLEGEKSTAIDLLQILISASAAYPKPVNQQGSILANLLTACFPSLIDLLMSTPAEADLILTSGTRCLFSVFDKGLAESVEVESALSQDLAQKLIPPATQLINRLLSEEVSDMGCIEVGPLLSIMLIRCPSFIHNQDLALSLLHAVVLRVQRAQMLDVKQSLFCVIAKLLCTSPEPVIQYLESRQLFAPVMQLWMQEYSQFYESYISKLSVQSFRCLLLSPSGQALLSKLSISIPLVTAPKRVTRSTAKKAAATESWQKILAPVRLLQLILGEFQAALEKEDIVDEDFEGSEGGFDSDEDGSFDEENEWDPHGEDEDEEGRFMGVDDILDGYDDQEEELSVILVKKDPLTRPPALVRFTFPPD